MTLVQRAIAILRRFGANAHIVLPGATQVGYGPELSPGTDFTAGYTNNGFATISTSGSVLTVQNTGAVEGQASFGAVLAGSTYQVSINVTSVFGSGRVTIGGVTTTLGGSTGLKTFVIVAGASTNIVVASNNSTVAGVLAFSSLSIKQVITSSVVLNGLTAGNYLLSDGSTGLSSVDQPVGLALDATGSVGSELVTNGDFSNGLTGWNSSSSSAIALSSGAVVVTRTSAVTYPAVTSSPATIAVAAGSTYRISCSFTNPLGLEVYVGLSGDVSAARSTATSGVIEYYAVAASSNIAISAGIWANSGSIGNSVTLDNISVRQVTGIHATASGAARPTLRRGAFNLLRDSGTIGGSGWSLFTGCASTLNTGPDPIGGNAASTLTFNTTSNAATFNNTQPTLVIGNTYTFSVWSKSASANQFRFRYYGTPQLASSNITTSSVWTKYSFTFVANAVSANLGIENDSAWTAGAIDVFGAQLELGSTASDYSPTTTAAASNANSGKYALEFADAQSLTLGSVPFQMADDHFVVAGANYSVIASSGKAVASPAANSGSFAKAAAITTNTANTVCARWTSDTPTDFTIATPMTAGQTFVASARKTSNTGDFRLNGVSKGTVSLAGVTATLNAGYVGFEGGSNLAAKMNGTIGPVIYAKGTISDADLLTLERFVASLTPNAPSF